MKRFFKNIVLYLCATILTAVGFVLINSPKNNKSTLDVNTPPEASTPFDKMLGSVMTSSGFEIGLDMAIEGASAEPLLIDGVFNLDMSKGFDALAVQGNVNLNNEFIDITYLDNYIYLSMLDGNYKISTSSIFDLVSIFQNLVGDNLNLDIVHKIDVAQILTALQSMTDTESGENRILSCNILGLDLSITTDSDYKIKNVQTGVITTEGITITPKVNLNYLDAPKIIQTPSKNHIDVSNAYKLVKATKNLIDSKKINASANLVYDNQTYNAQIMIDFESDLKLKLISNILDTNIQLTLLNQTIYADIGGLHLKFNLKDINKLEQALSNFGIDLSPYLNLFNSNLDLGKIDLSKTDLSKIDLSKIDLSNISLSFLKALNITDNCYEIVLDNIGNIKINLEENSIDFDNDDIKANLSILNEDFSIDIQNINYLDLSLILDAIDAVNDTISQSNFAGTIKVNINETIINLQYDLTIVEGLVNGIIKTNIYGVNVTINIIDNEFYLNVYDIYIHATINDIIDILNSYGVALPTSRIKDTITQILGLIDSSENLITKREKTDNTLTLELFNGLSLNLSYDEKLSNIKANFKDNFVDININSSNEQKSYTLDTSKYINVSQLMQVVNNLIDYINNKQFYFNIDIIALDYNVTGFVNYDADGLVANLSTQLLQKELFIKIKDNTCYVLFDGINAKLNLCDVSYVLKTISAEFNIEIPQTIFDMLDNLDNFEYISKLLNSNTNINLLDILPNLSVKYAKESIVATFNNFNLNFTLTDSHLQNITFDYDNINAQLSLGDKNNVEIPEIYFVNIKDLVKFIPKIKPLKESKNFAGTINLAYNNINVDLDYQLAYLDNSLKAKLSTNFYGLDIILAYENDTIFANIAGLDVKASTSEINDIIYWLNSTFNTNINLDNSTNDLSFKCIQNILVTEDSIKFILKNAEITLSLKNEITLDVNYNELSAHATLNQSNSKININADDYKHYSNLTNLINGVINAVKDKQIAVNANAKVYENSQIKLNATGNLQLDFKNSLNMYGEVLLTGSQDFEFNIACDNKMWYVNYNKLKVKLAEGSLLEILNIACNNLNIDTSAISFLRNVSSQENLNFNNLQNLIPQMSDKDPLEMLYVVKGLSYNKDYLRLTLDGTKLSGNVTAKDVVIEFILSNDELKTIIVDTDSTKLDGFNLELSFNKFEGVTQLSDKENYLDLSSISGLIKAFVNTSNLNDFHITANIDVNMQVLSINKPIQMTIPIDIQVKLVDKKPQIMAQIGPIPVIVPVDNDVPFSTGDTINGIYCGLNRILSVYYKDNYVYFYRTEQVPRVIKPNRTYEKMLKVTLDEFLADPLMILSYGCGFQDIIMDEIQKSMEKTKNRETPIDLSNILLGFNSDANTYTLILNLQEIANNSQLDTITISLTTTTIDDKEYISNGSLSVNMPLANAFKLDLVSDDLSLVDIGTPLDWSTFNQFILSYPYKVDEQWHASNGKWELVSSTTYTVYFEENADETVPDITDAVNTKFDLPILHDYVVDDGKTKVSYYFDGWFTSNTFEDESRYSVGVITRGDLILYAKWNSTTEYYYDVYFVNDLVDMIDHLHEVAGTQMNINLVFDNVQISTTDSTKTYAFEGWYEDEQFTKVWTNGNFVPSYNVTLYAKWTLINEVKTKLVNIYDNDTLISSTGHIVGEQLVLPTDINIVDTTKWFTDDSYTTEFTMPTIMPDSEITVYISNIYTVTIVDTTCNNQTITLTGYQNEPITLPDNYQTKIVDDNTQTKQETYTFNGFDQNLTCIPNASTTINVVWNYDVKYYFNVTFSKDNNVLSAYKSYIQFPVTTLRYLEGTIVYLSSYIPTWIYKTSKSVYWHYEFKGWSKSKGGSNITQFVLDQDTTIYANWNGTVKLGKG